MALLTATVLWTSAGPSRLSAAPDTVTKTVDARATVASRTSLQVSTDLLNFNLLDAERSAVATVDYVAGIRTHAGAEVVLTVEAVDLMGAAVTFSGDGAGTTQGTIVASRPIVAGRWVGSGRHTGRIVFELRAPVAGRYTLPVRFVVSAP
jgi:hypothetical protein